jgi:hypothetical protein
MARAFPSFITAETAADRPWLGTLAADEAFTRRYPSAKVIDAAAFGNRQAGFAAHLQAKIDEARNESVNTTHVPQVIIPAGEYNLNATINWKSCDIDGMASPNNGVRIFWEGSAGGTAFVRTAADPGGTSYGAMRNINFRNGSTAPGIWLDLTAASVDVHFQLERLHFLGSTVAAIDMAGWVNAHWRNLRFDLCGGYAIRATPPGSQFLGSFVVDQFTYDHQRGDNLGQGVILVDNTALASNIGTVTLRGGRIELNTAWSGNKAIFTMKYGASAQSRACGFHLDDVNYYDIVGMSDDALIARETSNTTGIESVTVTKSRFAGLSAFKNGNWFSGAVLPPVSVLTSSEVSYLATGQGTGTRDFWVKPTSFALTDAPTIATDAARADVFTVTLGGNRALGQPTNPTDGQQIEYRILQDGTGNRTLTYSSAFRFNTTFPQPTLSTAAGALDILRFVHNSVAGKWECVGIIKA